MAFLAPILLSGLVLASVPVIIHLLNRRRFQTVEWAPMKYLKMTIKTNRRRLRIEQLLLLALRTLLIVVLVLAVARPVLTEGAGLGGWLRGRGGRVSRLLVVDDSLSMGYRADRATAFAQARDVASELIKSAGPQDALTVLLTSAPDAPLVREAHLDEPAKLLGLVAALEVSDTRSDWAATLKAVDALLSGATFPTREVVLVTDLRRSGWGDGVREVADRWAAAGVSLRVVDVGSRRTENVSLASLEQEDPVALPFSPLGATAHVRSAAAAPLVGAQATLEFAGNVRPVALPDVAPGQGVELPLSVTPQKPGHFPLRLSLPPDALPADDTRWLDVPVRPNVGVTLVDGEPGARPFESETDFLTVAFTAGAFPWDVKRQTDADWLAARPVSADVLVLANVATLPPAHVAALEKLVAAGMGLMVFVGDQVDPEVYNDRLFRDGAGLLPARLGGVVEDPVTGLVVEQADDSPLAALAKVSPAALARIVVKKYVAADVPKATTRASDPVRVLARWNDPQGRPAVVEKRFGRGRVLLWTVTADRQWSDWPIDPVYVLAVRSAATAVARSDANAAGATAGQPIRVQLDEGQAATDAKVTTPLSKDPQPLSVEKKDDEPPVLTYSRTTRAGVYTLSWKDAAGAEQTRPVVVNGDKAESDLAPIPDAELRALAGNLDVPIVHYAPGQTLLTREGKEVWRTLAQIVLAMAAVESVFAVWVGRER
jgi:hypothetical protein